MVYLHLVDHFSNMRCFARFGTIVQRKKREKHPWRSVTFSKVASFFKLYIWHEIAQSDKLHCDELIRNNFKSQCLSKIEAI